MRHWQDLDTLAWSPDSRTVVAVTGSELGTKQLVIIAASSGKVLRRIATGRAFSGASFSPHGSALVYARGTSPDLYTVKPRGGGPVRLTRAGPRAVTSRARAPARSLTHTPRTRGCADGIDPAENASRLPVGEKAGGRPPVPPARATHDPRVAH